MKSYTVTSLALFLFTILSVQADVIRSSISIHSGVEGFRPGDVIPVALRIEVPDGWYTYAEDPGDAGMPPNIRFRAPEGVEIGVWRFPPHETFKDTVGTSYGFTNQVVLLNEITIPEEIPENVSLQAAFDVVWMICKDMCLPFQYRVTLTLPKVTSDAEIPQAEGWISLLQNGGWEVDE